MGGRRPAIPSTLNTKRLPSAQPPACATPALSLYKPWDHTTAMSQNRRVNLSVSMTSGNGWPSPFHDPLDRGLAKLARGFCIHELGQPNAYPKLALVELPARDLERAAIGAEIASGPANLRSTHREAPASLRSFAH